MAQGDITDEELADLVRRNEAAASAFINGDTATYVDLVPHADDYTLMPPFGGETQRAFDDSPEALEGLSRWFTGGEAQLEVHETYTSGDLAVLVLTERQHGLVGGRPDQDWSLRVTVVWRRVGSQWELVHRHADPLVHSITWDQLADLARG
jgi:ketosteroid isomerase-like protein